MNFCGFHGFFKGHIRRIDGRRFASMLFPEPEGQSVKRYVLLRLRFPMRVVPPTGLLPLKSPAPINRLGQRILQEGLLPAFCTNQEFYQLVDVFDSKHRMPSTTAPSSAFCLGTNIFSYPSCLACSTIGRTPFTGRISPFRESSPKKTELFS